MGADFRLGAGKNYSERVITRGNGLHGGRVGVPAGVAPGDTAGMGLRLREAFAYLYLDECMEIAVCFLPEDRLCE